MCEIRQIVFWECSYESGGSFVILIQKFYFTLKMEVWGIM